MIWVVTEHTDTRRTVASLLIARGYTVSEIDCGKQVAKRLQFQLPTLIVLDCGVPGSFDMLLTIRANGAGRSVPVVMFSIDDQNLRDKCLLVGANAYVPRGSLDWAELLTEIVRFAGPPSERQPR